ncbi:MAG: glycosyltransferase family A protein [Candidatus Omnitrophica bacterium]|nr:glycosyltransferase family A protein [Candidatus Omnitrophota bacterium]
MSTKYGKCRQPLVSVIIPTYNRADLLPRAIESVLNQTYQNIELIIVDDCSQDNTQEVINNYLNKDKRIISLRNKKNEEQSYSRNLGIEHSRGVFLAFLDDDCEYLPDKMDREIDLMNSLITKPSIIYSNMWIQKEGAETMLPLNKKSKLLTQKDIFSCRYTFMEPSTWFCDKVAIKKINGFDTKIYAFIDIDLLMRALLDGQRIYFLNLPLTIKYRVEGVSTVSIEYISGKEVFLEKHRALLKKHKKYLSRFYYGLAKDFLRLKEFDKAKTYFWQAFLLEPIKIEYLFKSIYPVESHAIYEQ